MNTPSHPNPPSWDGLRQVWRRESPANKSLLQSSPRLRRLWASEARRRRWISLGSWALGLAMASILSFMALQVAEGGAGILLGLSAFGCLAQPGWTHWRRRKLWLATADSPRAYWTLRTEHVAQERLINRAGAWWFGVGMLFGVGIRRMLPEGSWTHLEPLSAAGPGLPWVALWLVFPGTLAVLFYRDRRLSRQLDSCRAILASLDPEEDRQAIR